MTFQISIPVSVWANNKSLIGKIDKNLPEEWHLGDIQVPLTHSEDGRIESSSVVTFMDTSPRTFDLMYKARWSSSEYPTGLPMSEQSGFTKIINSSKASVLSDTSMSINTDIGMGIYKKSLTNQISDSELNQAREKNSRSHPSNRTALSELYAKKYLSVAYSNAIENTKRVGPEGTSEQNDAKKRDDDLSSALASVYFDEYR